MSTPRLQQLFGFLDQNPKDSFITFAIAKEYEGLNDLDNALKYYLQLIETDANYVGTYYHLGKLYEILTQESTAIATYDKGMEIAKAQGDKHAYSELMGAKEWLEG